VVRNSRGMGCVPIQAPFSPRTPWRAVVEKSGFAYMKAHETRFEMAPPNFFSVHSGSFFVSGSAQRGKDVGPGEQERILAFCRERLQGSSYPAADFYPDLRA